MLTARLITTFSLLLLLSACSTLFGPDEPEPVTYALDLKAGNNINPSQLSQANPVVLHLYQLSDVAPFNNAEVLDLFQQDAKTLSASLIHKSSFGSLLPGETRKVQLEVKPGTKYLAVFAEFANYGQAKAKTWVDISKLEDIESFSLSVDLLSVNLQAVVDDSWW